MEILVMVSVASTAFLFGYMVGKAQGEADGSSRKSGTSQGQKNYEQGLYEGAQIALELVDKHMKGGLTSVLDWETAQRLLREQMSRN